MKGAFFIAGIVVGFFAATFGQWYRAETRRRGSVSRAWRER